MRKSLISELLSDAKSRSVVSALCTGVLVAILVVIFVLSYAAMIFSGDLSTLATRGVGLILCGGFLLCLFTAFTSGFRSAISMPEDPPAAVLSTMTPIIATTLGEHASMDARFMTVAAVLALSAFLTGVAFILIGRFRLANLLRFMPFPVMGGFVAGMGWVIVVGGIAVMCGIPVSLGAISRLAAPDMILKWLPGVLFGVVLLATSLRCSNVFILPAFLLVGIALFYAALFAGGESIDGARKAGLLVSSLPAEGLWPAFSLKDLALIDWATVRGQLPGIFSIIVVTAVGMLLNMTGIEAGSGEEIDMNAEYTSSGMGNCLAALGGGMPGYPAISFSLLGLKTGAYTRLTGIVTASILGGVLFFGGGLLEYFPKALLGGMLLWLGLYLIYDWIVASRKRMPWPDYLIMVSILFVVGIFGFLESVAFGLAVSVVFFVIRFSRVSVIKSEFTALQRRSVRKRSVPHRKLLQACGNRIQCYALSGYLFFGSAATLGESLKGALTSERASDLVLLDFSDVSGFDISAVNAFRRFVLNARAANIAIAITAASDRLTQALKLSLSESGLENIVFFPDLDHGLEWCEDQLIERLLSNMENVASMRETLFDQSVDELLTHLDRQDRFELLVDRLSPWLEHREYSSGTAIQEKGQPVGGLYLVTRGAAMEVDPRTGVRLRSLVAGDVIAVSAAFDCYTAPTTIRPDEDCQTAFLSLDARRLLEEENPNLAIALHGFLIRSGSR